MIALDDPDAESPGGNLTARLGYPEGKEYTLRRPAIVTTSQAGEKLSRIASLQHGGGTAAG